MTRILPDVPEACATASIIAIFYGIIWLLGLTASGGAILAVLAWLGSLFGGIPGIPPAIGGIIFLCIMFKVLCELFSLIF